MNLKQTVYEKIRYSLLSGDHNPNDRLSEVMLAEKINVSRTPVREAMSRLESEGFLERIPGMGSYIRKLSRSEIEELYDLRALLEGYAAALAAKRIRPNQIEELERICSELWSCIEDYKSKGLTFVPSDKKKEFSLQDVLFHSLIVEASGNSLVVKAVGDFRIMSQIIMLSGKETTVQAFVNTYQAHMDIINALRASDSNLVQECIQQHILEGKKSACAACDAHEAGNESQNVRPELSLSIKRIIGRF
jgi:DNA-binding GntR family transcriptional regulator